LVVNWQVFTVNCIVSVSLLSLLVLQVDDEICKPVEPNHDPVHDNTWTRHCLKGRLVGPSIRWECTLAPPGEYDVSQSAVFVRTVGR